MRKLLILLIMPISIYTQTNTFPTSGNVGIGTTTPTSELEIKSSSNNNSELHINTSTNNGISIIRFQDAGQNTWGFLSNYPSIGKFSLHNYQNNSNAYVIDQNGNLGIGTYNPVSKLHIEGMTSVGKNGILTLDWTNETNWGGSSNRWSGFVGFNAYRSNGEAKDHYYGRNVYTNKGVFEGSNYGFRWLYRNRINNDSNGQHLLTEYMRLTNNGYLGIGTTTPDSKLTVKGKVHAEEVKVDLSVPGPDYVFKEGYNLRSLEEVKDYINKNGHLPNIPSAKEMETNGVELGIMNMKLLEKIEELTLYVIELKKENIELRNDINKIKNTAK